MTSYGGRFRVIASHLSKMANLNLPHLHLAAPLGVKPFEFCRDLWQQESPGYRVALFA